MSENGDYISHEALVARIRYHIEKAKFCGLENHEATQLLTEAADALEQIPAADVRPVVRAHWYWDKNGMDWNIGAWRCSACHSRPETWWQGDSNSPRNKSGHYFCPNCGADMRGEQDV